jgi:hypothetical protein
MTIPQIIKLLQNPATIADALTEIGRINFSQKDRVIFNQKRTEFHAGMTDYRKNYWVSELTDFLNNHSQQVGDYTVDRDFRWHHLDRHEMKRKFKKLYRENGSKVKTLLFEYNEKAVSLCSHEILHSFYTFECHCNTNIKGSLTHFTLDTSSTDDLEQDWTDFVKDIFDLQVDFADLSAEYKRKGLHRQPHFICQSVNNFSYENFKGYLNLWKKLEPTAPVFLIFHVSKGDLRDYPDEPDLLFFKHNQYEKVKVKDINGFLHDYREFYSPNCLLDFTKPMTFKKALEVLQFSEPPY